jgi:Na+/melibiose symporter-like transporter
MKQRKTKSSRISGAVGAFLLILVLMFFSNNSTGLSQICFWILLGPIIFFIMLFTLFFSKIITKEEYMEEEKLEQVLDLKSIIIGFFIWLIILVATYLLNIEFSQFTNEIGGLATMLVVMTYMRKKSNIPIF